MTMTRWTVVRVAPLQEALQARPSTMMKRYLAVWINNPANRELSRIRKGSVMRRASKLKVYKAFKPPEGEYIGHIFRRVSYSMAGRVDIFSPI